MMERCEITEEEIMSKQTAAGGWTRKQLEKWGVGEWWPKGQSSPTHGWRRELERRRVQQELAADLTTKLQASVDQAVESNAAK